MTSCESCVLRLFNDKGYNICGVGNIWSGNALVLPNVDNDAYKKQDMSFSSQVEVISNILSTGGLEQNLYVMPFIRCKEFKDIEITNDIIRRCLNYFYKDVKTHQISNIMLCGDAARRYLNIDDIKTYLDIIIYDTKTGIKYFVNYSPLVKYTNEELFKSFELHLNKYYNSVINNFYEYEVMTI